MVTSYGERDAVWIFARKKELSEEDERVSVYICKYIECFIGGNKSKIVPLGVPSGKNGVQDPYPFYVFLVFNSSNPVSRSLFLPGNPATMQVSGVSISLFLLHRRFCLYLLPEMGNR